MKSLVVFSLFLVAVVSANDIIVTNNCKETIWIGITVGVGDDRPENGGFELKSSASKTLTVAKDWQGRIWGRTNCDENGVCETGDCGNGIECAGNSPDHPVTIAEVILGGGAKDDTYDVSLVIGYNLPIRLGPANGTDVNCTVAGCVSDLNEICPPELIVANEDRKTIGCTSLCEGNSGCNSDSEYFDIFRQACPLAYAFPFDKNLFHCKGEVDYEILFCP